MRRRLVPVLSLLVLMAPVAGASHGYVEGSLAEDLTIGDSMTITIRHTHTIRSSFQYQHEEREELEDGGVIVTTTIEQGSASYTSFDVFGGRLLRTEFDDSLFEHEGDGTREVKAETSHSNEITVRAPKRSSSTRHETECDHTKTHHDERLGRIVATLEGADKLRIQTNLHDDRASGFCMWKTVVDGETREGGDQWETAPVNTAILPAYNAYEGFHEVVIPLTSERHTVSRSQSFEFPGDDEGDGYRLFRMCMLPFVKEGGSGRCTVSSGMEILIEPSACAPLQRALDHHLALLRTTRPIPDDAPEPWVLLWAEHAWERARDVLQDARGLQLVGCDARAPFDDILALDLMLRDALLEIHKREGLSPRGVVELVRVDRMMQLLGKEDEISILAELERASPPSEELDVAAYSPVELRLRDEQGRIAGWLDGEARTDIPGSSLEGEPGSFARVRVPAGFYKVEVEETGEGDFMLDIGWNGTSGGAREAIHGMTRDGRTTTMHVGLDRVDSNGTPMLDLYPLQRITSATGAFYEAWAPEPPSAPEVLAAGGALGTLPGNTGGETDAGLVDAGERTPLPTWVAALGMLGALMLLGRKRR